MGIKVQYLETAFLQISDTGSIHTTSSRSESKKTTKSSPRQLYKAVHLNRLS